jgi:hypothetical protein
MANLCYQPQSRMISRGVSSFDASGRHCMYLYACEMEEEDMGEYGERDMIPAASLYASLHMD